MTLAGCAAYGLEELTLQNNPALVSFFKEHCTEALKSIDLDRGGARRA